MVQEVPEQVNSGNMVLAPIVFPWVLEEAIPTICEEEDSRNEKMTTYHQLAKS